MQDFTSFICYAMKSTMRKLERYMSREFEKYGINLGQAFVLFALMENDGSTISEVANRTRIENSSLTNIVDRLEKEGLVERRLDPQDRRIIRLFITGKGRELGEQVLNMGTWFDSILRENLNGRESGLLDSLNIISDTLDRLESNPR